MQTLQIPIHSVVDVITNSSTEIYTYPTENAVEAVTALIEAFMTELGVEGSASDYFDITLSVDPIWEDKVREIAQDYLEVDKLIHLEEHIQSGGYIHPQLVSGWDYTYRKGLLLTVTSKKSNTVIDLEKLCGMIYESNDCDYCV